MTYKRGVENGTYLVNAVRRGRIVYDDQTYTAFYMERLALTRRDSLEAIYGAKQNHVGSHQLKGLKDKGPSPARQSLHTRYSGGPKLQPKGVSKQTQLGTAMVSKKSPRPGEFSEAQLPPIKSSAENKVVKSHTKKQTSIGSRQDQGGQDESYDGNGRKRIVSPSRANQLSVRNNSSRSSSQSSGISSFGKGTSPKTTSMQRGFSKTQKPSLDPLPSTLRQNPVKTNNSAGRAVDTKPAKAGKFPVQDDVLRVKYDGTGSKLTNSNRPSHQAAHTSNSMQGVKPVKGAINTDTETIKPFVSGGPLLLDNNTQLLSQHQAAHPSNVSFNRLHQAAHTSNSKPANKPVPLIDDHNRLLMGHQAAHTSNSKPANKPVPSIDDHNRLLLGHQAAHTSNSKPANKPVPSIDDHNQLLVGHQAAHTSNSKPANKPVPSIDDYNRLLLGHQAAHTSNSKPANKPVPSIDDYNQLLMGHQAAHTSNSKPANKPVPSIDDYNHLLMGHQAAHTSNSKPANKPVPLIDDYNHLLMGHQAAHTSNTS